MQEFIRQHRTVIGLFILAAYIVIPFLDSTLCTDCMGSAPFQGEISIGHLQAPHNDMAYSSAGSAQTASSDSEHSKSSCSICSTVPMGVNGFSHSPHFIVTSCSGTLTLPALSEPHFPISKPPQNLLV